MLLAPLIVASPVWADAIESPSMVDSLQIRLLDDRATGVAAGTRTAHAFAIQVTDVAGASIKDAAIVFRLPESGPSGKFVDGSTANIVYTDTAGKADAGEITWGTEQGPVAVRITATKGDAHAGMLYEQLLSASVPHAEHQPVTAPTPQIPAVSASPAVVERNSSQPVVIQPKTPAAMPRRPGALALETEASAHNVVIRDQDSPDANVPVHHVLGNSNVNDVPSVSIESSGGASGGGHHKAKWIALVAVAAGAGAAFAFMHNGSSSSSGSASGISIGAPTVSVGHP
jgi:hypothetical protein